MKTIFVTYNPNSEFEQTLAVRLHTIGAANGFLMYLPDRYNSNKILDEETKSRIMRADYVVMFSISPLSSIVKSEIEFAFNVLKDKSRIVVVYDKQQGKNLTGQIASYFTQIYSDHKKQDMVLHEIINAIQGKENATLKKEKENAQALAALFGIGLGLLMLGSVSDSK